VPSHIVFHVNQIAVLYGHYSLATSPKSRNNN